MGENFERDSKTLHKSKLCWSANFSCLSIILSAIYVFSNKVLHVSLDDEYSLDHKALKPEIAVSIKPVFIFGVSAEQADPDKGAANNISVKIVEIGFFIDR